MQPLHGDTYHVISTRRAKSVYWGSGGGHHRPLTVLDAAGASAPPPHAQQRPGPRTARTLCAAPLWAALRDDLQKPRPVRHAGGASQILRVEGEARPAAGRVEVIMSSSSPYQHRQARQRQLELAAKAHHLRHHPTLTEQRLWAELRNGRLGVTFRRQVVIGRFIADFACTHPRLVVEVDGGVHADRSRLDAQRDAHLRRAGYQVLRIPAALVTSNLPAAVSRVREALAQQ